MKIRLHRTYRTRAGALFAIFVLGPIRLWFYRRRRRRRTWDAQKASMTFDEWWRANCDGPPPDPRDAREVTLDDLRVSESARSDQAESGASVGK